MPTKSVETIRTHGAAGYHAGCRCDDCKAGPRKNSRAQRKRLRAVRPRRPGEIYKPCIMCGEEFNTRGLPTHEASCDG